MGVLQSDLDVWRFGVCTSINRYTLYNREAIDSRLVNIEDWWHVLPHSRQFGCICRTNKARLAISVVDRRHESALCAPPARMTEGKKRKRSEDTGPEVANRLQGYTPDSNSVKAECPHTICKALAVSLNYALPQSNLYHLQRKDVPHKEYILLHVIQTPPANECNSKSRYPTGCRIQCSATHEDLYPVVDSMMKETSIPMNRNFRFFAPAVLHTCAGTLCDNRDGCNLGDQCTLIAILISLVTRPDGETTGCTSVCKIDYGHDDSAYLNHLVVQHPSSPGGMLHVHRKEMATMLLRFIVHLSPAELDRIGIPRMETLEVGQAMPAARDFYRHKLPDSGLFSLRYCILADMEDEDDQFCYDVVPAEAGQYDMVTGAYTATRIITNY